MKKRFKVPVLLLLSVLLLAAAAGGLCAETTRGHVRIVGYKDSFPSDGRKFAPRAVLQDVPYEKGHNLYLEYRYHRFNGQCRLWKVRVTDANGKTASYPGRLNVILPYPSIWSAQEQAYWKWTSRYAERYDWFYTRGDAAFANAADDWVIETEAVKIELSAKEEVAVFHPEESARSVLPENPFGIIVPMGRGLREKAICIEFE